jgi:trehalose synthase
MESAAPLLVPPEPTALSRYQPLIGVRATQRLLRKARRLRGLKVLHVNSSPQGGGVAEILSSLVPLMNELGITTDWFVITGSPEFFSFTKDVHNALHGEPVALARERLALHADVAHANGSQARLDTYDLIIVHDPQPLRLVELRRSQRWVWCCHIDLSAPYEPAWEYLAQSVNGYDAVVFSLPEYAQPLAVPQRFMMPAIDPFSLINQPISRPESTKHLERYGVGWDLPLVVQAGRFDKWKDPEGVIAAFRLACAQVPATLVLVGNTAPDDPEGPAMYERLQRCAGEQIIIIEADDPLLVNALQRRASVVLQKSLREGFGLTVSEAMWKGRPVIGGNAGGIRHQIVDTRSGFLVNSVEETATRIVTLLQDRVLRRSMGRRAEQRVRQHFLMTRLVEDWLDLIDETVHKGVARTPTRVLAA